MAKVFIEETTLTAIGDAIRSKTGKTELIDPANMSTEIAGIEAGGASIPEEAFNFTGDCSYMFKGGAWTWFLNGYSDRITTTDITKANEMFANNQNISEIPFVINVLVAPSEWSSVELVRMFNACRSLTVCPKIRGSFVWNNYTDLSDIISNCTQLRDVEDLFTIDMTEGFSACVLKSSYSVPKIPNFNYLQSLRRVPSWWYGFKLNPESKAFPYSSYAIYHETFCSCIALDEAVSIPVWHCKAGLTENIFDNTFIDCYRLKAVTFETDTENGNNPIVANWANQVIDLSIWLGTANPSYASILTVYNTGISEGDRVSNDTDYQAKKDNPNWYTDNYSYSRYNHDSAVGTINSLPDTSAYLASAGGTNTIKFKGEAGSATDGGAINTLTEAEIAVAAAKGWTVTLV